MSDLLTAIERQYSFELPPLYHRLYQDGMLDWFLDSNGPNPNWHRDIFPRLRQRPPMLLFAQDFELYTPQEVLSWEHPWDWNTTYHFVPLGHTGAGDLYAFCPSLATDSEVPITLSLHDSNETTVLAPSLEGFIFREMLYRATSFDEYDLEGYTGFEDLRADWQRAAQAITPYLKPIWNTILAEVYARPVQAETIVLPRYSYTVNGLLSQAEFAQLIEQEIGFAKLNSTFEHFAV